MTFIDDLKEKHYQEMKKEILENDERRIAAELREHTLRETCQTQKRALDQRDRKIANLEETLKVLLELGEGDQIHRIVELQDRIAQLELNLSYCQTRLSVDKSK